MEAQAVGGEARHISSAFTTFSVWTGSEDPVSLPQLETAADVGSMCLYLTLIVCKVLLFLCCRLKNGDVRKLKHDICLACPGKT